MRHKVAPAHTHPAFDTSGMDFGIVYHIENAHQFWSELEEIVTVSSNEQLGRIDNALKSFLSFCAEYHERYLQTSLQLEHACSMLLDSDIFAWHSERLSDIILDTASNNANPHLELIIYSTLLIYGRRNPTFLRSKTKWKPIMPLLMDHVLIEMDDDIGGNVDLGRGPTTASGIGIPIEARLRSLSIGILYEVCRVQKFDLDDLRTFTDSFLEHLFDLVELTRNVDDETLNYSVIKLVAALNEQYMVAGLPSSLNTEGGKKKKERKAGSNKIVEVLMRRIHSSKTFGENIIFMLNRTNNTEEDLVLQLLLLKVLYVLFTTPGTHEYFYTNDLRVLVDVFLRELSDLPEESEALRHTYLRVLNPLLTNTQLREVSYKRPQIQRTLQAMLAHSNIREITPTTRRLVERCLNADWCRILEQEATETSPTSSIGSGFANLALAGSVYPSISTYSNIDLTSHSASSIVLEPPKPAFKFKTMHKSASVEVLHPPTLMSSSSSSLPPIADIQVSFSSDRAGHSSVASKHIRNGSSGQSSSHSRQSSDIKVFETTPSDPLTSHRPPPAPPEGRIRRKSHGQQTRAEAAAALATYRHPVSTQAAHGVRHASMGTADLPRMDKDPPPVPKLDRSSLDSQDIVPARRKPPAIPSKANKPKPKGTVSDSSPLSKLAYSANSVAR